MNLKDIEEKARYVKDAGYSIWVDERNRYVSIDHKSKLNSIFLQSGKADAFIRKARHLWRDPAAMVGLQTYFEAVALDHIKESI